jgi:hypothetical protein
MKLSNRLIARLSLSLAIAATAGSALAADSARWKTSHTEIRDKKYDVYLPRFSPDSRALAYAVTVPTTGEIQIAFAEIRRYSFADRKTKVLLPLAETKRMADWGAYPMSIEWTGTNTLKTDLSNGDDGYNVYRLQADRTGSTSYESFGAGEEYRPPRTDPALRAIVSDWPMPVFENAWQYMVRIRAHGALVQKRYANQDDHLWWLDLGDREARIALDAPNTMHQELMQGFAFGDYAVFALRRGTTVTAQRLDGDGRLQEIEGSPVEIEIGPDAIGSGAGAVDNRRCSATVCWAAYRVRHDDRWQTRILRLDREGRAQLLPAIEGLEDFDVSPDFERLAAAVVRDDKRTIKVFDILAF